MSHWLYKGEPYNPAFEDIDAAGFVYRITNLTTGQMYIGRKKLTQWKKLPPLKGKKNKRKVIFESDWRTYRSSSEEVKADIEQLGIEHFKFEILSFHVNLSELNYYELKTQVYLDVLEEKLPNGDWAYYNKNIERRYYRSEVYHEERLELNEALKLEIKSQSV